MTALPQAIGALVLALAPANSAQAPGISVKGSVYVQSDNQITQTKSTFLNDGEINIGVVSDIEGALGSARSIADKLSRLDLDAVIIAGDSCRNSVQEMVGGIAPFARLGVPAFVIPGNREAQTVYTSAIKRLQADHPHVFDIRERKVDLQGVNLVGMGGYHHPRFTSPGGFLLQARDYERARGHLVEFQRQDEPTIFVTHGPPLASTVIDYVAGVGHVGDANIKAIMDGDFKHVINVHGHIHEGGRNSDQYKAGPAYNVAAVTTYNNPKGPNGGLITISDGKVSYSNID